MHPAAAAPAAAQVALNPASGPAGSAVKVSGTGFKAATTGTVIVGSATFGFRTSATGSFSTGITIPATAAGSITVTAKTAAWNTDLVSYLAAQPDVMGFVWFHLQKEADWRINSSESSAAALRNALLARRS
ncbi:hypothetical protein [Pseudarthrobacter sp. NamE2]|uniref:hypothetical protein n=1 Tax=Pseudarthrobacter sp. NamE2 TaxID=2576838 RepID=UPI001F0E2273|nr:hypothetical protein [Pseudarthrobacter sp. NamE2]